MKKIQLYGELGKKFGKLHEYNINTPAEAVRALCVNYPEFKKYMLENKDLPYRVIVDKEDIDEENFHVYTRETIKIVPLVQGAGSNVGRIIIGATIIFAAWAIPGGQWLAAKTAGATAQSFAVAVGANLILSGVIGLLTPTIDAPESPERVENFAFNGPVNTVRQGGPVPLAYGELIVGSHVISAGLSVEEQPI